jgi:hypothetical protein
MRVLSTDELISEFSCYFCEITGKQVLGVPSQNTSCLSDANCLSEPATIEEWQHCLLKEIRQLEIQLESEEYQKRAKLLSKLGVFLASNQKAMWHQLRRYTRSEVAKMFVALEKKVLGNHQRRRIGELKQILMSGPHMLDKNLQASVPCVGDKMYLFNSVYTEKIELKELTVAQVLVKTYPNASSQLCVVVYFKNHRHTFSWNGVVDPDCEIPLETNYYGQRLFCNRRAAVKAANNYLDKHQAHLDKLRSTLNADA